MDKNSVYFELQQLMYKNDNKKPLNKDCEIETGPSVIASKSKQLSYDEISSSHPLQQNELENNSQTSLFRINQVIVSPNSLSSRIPDSSYTDNHCSQNDKEKQKSSSKIPTVKQNKIMVPCKHHSFLSEVPDVRHMEQALLQLLEDFHTGNLRAFGKGCSMEKMNKIREQQEKLARLHFEMGQPQDEDEQSSFRQSNVNIQNILQRLEQLSFSIEQLHSNN